MSLLEDLRAERRLFAECPCCSGEFRLADAQLFDATKRLPDVAIEHIKQRKLELVAQRAELKRRREQAATGVAVTARAVNIGKSVEKIAPSLPGFPFRSEDCRCLLEPID
jgi:predicted Holliday junction resolvase-like endonuclease